MTCSECGTDNAQGSRFCMTCGSALGTDLGRLPPPPTPAPAPAFTVPAYLPPAPVQSGQPDPNLLGAAHARLGRTAKRGTQAAVLVAATILRPDERVEAAVGGKLEGHGALALLTDQSVLVVDDRLWRPVAERLVVDPSLTVLGWQDDRTAQLTFRVGDRELVVDQIVDRPLAVELAERIRYRTGAVT